MVDSPSSGVHGYKLSRFLQRSIADVPIRKDYILLKMIVLTGTSGGLGSGVLDTILKQKLLPPEDIVISTFSQSSRSLRAAKEAGILIRHGDMTRLNTLRDSYRGADVLFLVSYPSVGEERYDLHRTAVDAAREVGVKHIIYTSLTFGGPRGDSSYAGVMQAHLRTADYIKNSGLSWTIIREAPYAHLWNNFAGFLKLESAGKHLSIVVSDDGQHHWASRRDLAEGTAQVVANWFNYVNQTVNLTGSKTYSVKDIVSLYGQRTNRSFEFEKVGETEAVEYHKRQGSVPDYMEDFLPNWASWGVAMSKGEGAYVDPLLEELLGRPPLTIEDMQDELFAADTNALDIKDFV